MNNDVPHPLVSPPDAASDPGEPQFWSSRWQGGDTPWDVGGPYPLLQTLLSEARHAGLADRGARILEPGAGRAHTGAALARLGYDVTSFDVIPEAIVAARALYGGTPGLTLEVADALEVRADWVGRFHGIFDRAMLCALPRPRRARYADAVAAHLAPGGLFLSAVVNERRDKPLSGPPFAVSAADLDEMLSPRFSCVFKQVVDLPADPKVARELLSVWRRGEGGPA